MTQIERNLPYYGEETAIVILTKNGKPILPDLEKVKATGLLYADTSVTATNELTFTFNSTEYPWTSEELILLNQWISDFYPMTKIIWGNPAFNISVNVRKDPYISYAALYNTYTNEIVLPGVYTSDPFSHELLHAFRDDLIILIQVLDEGTVRAAEIKINNRLNYPHWDKHHSYFLDVYYEFNNQEAVASRDGYIFSGLDPLLKYQQSGYAWTKPLIEKADFFIEFNRKYYARALADPSISGNVEELKNIAREIKPKVEGKEFDKWYSRQNIFNMAPKEGYQIMLRGYGIILYMFYRFGDGYEMMVPDAEISWQIYGSQNEILGSGTGFTNDMGWVEISTYSLGYKGRIRIDVTARVDSVEIRQSYFVSTATSSGLFGIVKNRRNGKIKVYDKHGVRVGKALVINGAFAVPEVEKLAGKFTVQYYSNSGILLATRIVTKDASNYFVIINDK
jgi:hypothetical protein